MKQIIDQPNVRTKDALRLVALYTIRYSREVEKNLDHICGSVKGLYGPSGRCGPLSSGTTYGGYGGSPPDPVVLGSILGVAGIFWMLRRFS